MHVDQAIFTSSDDSAQRGYCLMSRSDGITDVLAEPLQSWGPSHNSLVDDTENAESLNYYEVANGQFAISRTVFGGPELSRRGELRIVTRSLLAQPDRLDGYAYNPWYCLRTCLALGLLRMPLLLSRSLPSVEIPDTSNLGSSGNSPQAGLDQRVEPIVKSLESGTPTAVLACDSVSETMSSIMRNVSLATRKQLSFTTGLRPSVQRPFRLHVYSSNDTSLRRQLEQMKIQVVSL